MAAEEIYNVPGTRWGWRTPSPDFARRAVSPISPLQVQEEPTSPQIFSPAPFHPPEASSSHPTIPGMNSASSHQRHRYRIVSEWEQSPDARSFKDPLDLLASVAVAERQHRQRISSANSLSGAASSPQPLPSFAHTRLAASTSTIPETRYSSGYFSSPSRPYSSAPRAPSTSPRRSPGPLHRDTYGYPQDAPGSIESPTQHRSSYRNHPEPSSPVFRENCLAAPSLTSRQPHSNEDSSSRSAPARTLVSPLLQNTYITSPVVQKSAVTTTSPSMAQVEPYPPKENYVQGVLPPTSTPPPTAAVPAQVSEHLSPKSSLPGQKTHAFVHGPDELRESGDGTQEVKHDVVMEDPKVSLPTPTQNDHVGQVPINLLNALVTQNEPTSGHDIAKLTPEVGNVANSMELDSPGKQDRIHQGTDGVVLSSLSLNAGANGDVEMSDVPKLVESTPLSTVAEDNEMTDFKEDNTFASVKLRKRRSVSRTQRRSVDRVTRAASTAATIGQDMCPSCGELYDRDNGSKGPWIECDGGCKTWMHALCAGFETSQVKKIDKFYCKSCQLTHGPSTMKRSSGRAHTAIDYNALHNGSAIPLRNPEDARLHPYICIIRDKTYPFAEENFQRVRPEFVTAENLNNMPGGWNEPFVVPANENIRPWHQEDTDPGSPMSIPSPVELAGSKVLPPPPETDSKDDILPKDEMDDINRRCGLDMMIPRGLTVRKVGEAVGMDRPVEVFNVLTQQSTERWKMNDLVNYFENPAREVIYNCISCEVTSTPLGPQISRPRAVRDTDLVDRVWRHIPYIARPTVGKYVLMSVKDSFTDFHIDFAGSSVFYHVYEGEKVFLLIEPTEKALKAYEAWNLDPHMSAKFFPESIPEIPCRILTLHKGDTMFIPSGWIHAVYTPADSLVIGGNFLTKNHFANQMKVHHIEVVTGVPPNMKYPRYTTLMWFQALHYMENDPLPETVDSHIIDGQYADLATATAKEKEKSSVTYTPEEIQGLPYLVKFLHRNVMITLGVITTGQGPGTPKLTQKTVDAVKRAAPDPVNKDHLGYLKRFARWCTWKRVVSSTAPDERIPEWAQPSWTPPEKIKVEVTKKPSKFDAKPTSDVPRRNGLRERERRGTSISSEDQAQPVAIPATPAAKTAGSNTTTSAKRKAEQETNPAPTSGKKPKTSKVGRSTSHGNRHAEIPIMLEEGEQRVILSDGSIYVRKNSNLGPPRAGCQNCRLKKTGCKHKEEIAEILKGTWTAARAAHQAQVEAMEKEKSEKKGKEKAGGKAKEGGEEMILDEFAIASSSSDDEPLSSPPPPPSKMEKRRAASSMKKADQVMQQETKSVSTESAPSTAPVPPEVPATVVNGTGPPAGFKGRKPSCNECKALKKKCLHPNTWHNLPARAAPTPKKSKSASTRRKSTSNNVDSKQSLPSTDRDSINLTTPDRTTASTFTPATTGPSSSSASSKAPSPPLKTPDRETFPTTHLDPIPATPSTVHSSPPRPIHMPAADINCTSPTTTTTDTTTSEYIVSRPTVSPLSATITRAKPRTTRTTTPPTVKHKSKSKSPVTTTIPSIIPPTTRSSTTTKTPLKRRSDDDNHSARSGEKVKKRTSVDQLRTGLELGVEGEKAKEGNGREGDGDEKGMYRAMALGLRVRKASVAGR